MKETTLRIALFSLMLMLASTGYVFSQEKITADDDWEDAKAFRNTLQKLIPKLKTLATQSMPTEVANTPQKAAEWNKQTILLDSINTVINAHVKNINDALKDNQIIGHEVGHMKAAREQLGFCYQKIIWLRQSASGAIRARYETASSYSWGVSNN